MKEKNLIFELRDKIFDLYAKAASSEDGVEDVRIDGEEDVELLQLASEIILLAKNLDVHTSIRLEIDEEYTEIDDLEPYLDGTYGFSKWCLNISKLVLSKGLKNKDDDTSMLFFFDEKVFKAWLSALDPLKSINNLFVENQSVLIFVVGLKASFGGPRLAVLPFESCEVIDSWWPFKSELPQENTLREHVHLVPSEPISLSPQSFELTWGDFGCDLASLFRRMSGMCAAAGLADVIYGQEKIVLKGVRHLEIPLLEKSEEVPDKDSLTLIQSALSWVYEERVDTRKRLLSDRLCLESDNEASFISLLVQHLDDSLKQSKDQYRFVILDRKDEYAKELRDLLKDLRQQADLYAEKVRGLIAGLLRDTLAAFVFVALSLSSRLGSNADVLMSGAGVLFFKALAIYFIVSAFFQSTSALRDIWLSDKELEKWSEITREYFSRKEIHGRINEDLRGRRDTFYFYMVLIVISYLIMAGLSWNMLYLAKCFTDIGGAN
ncbi:hypothetical protein R3F64_11210 [Halomonas sp. 5021]|jgi:hypothetical protein|uniref:hypothetical protein n=1 Tax=Halomonas sp. 5021 TaxID=3082156 RepID=UPI002FCB4A2F